MDRKLKDLRQHMIDAKLHEMDFPEHRKQKVMDKMQKQPVEKLRFAGSIWWKRGLSIAVCLGLLFGGIAIAANHSGQPSNQLQPNSPHVNAVGASNKKEKQKYPPIKDPGHLTKEEIQSRMLHPNDYFWTAQGSFKEMNKVTGVNQTIRYEADFAPGHYGSYCQTLNPGTGVVTTEIANSKKTITIYNIDKQYMESGNSDPTNVGIAFHSLFPREIALNYLGEYKRWKIEKQNATILGYKVVVLKGSLNQYNSNKHHAVSFRLWVNKATGILMKKELYDAKGNVVESLVTTRLQLNKPVDTSKFVIHVPKGYTNEMKKMGKQTEHDPRVKKIQNIAGAKIEQGNVQKVFKQIQSHVPFLYVFKDPSLFLYSDSLNRYKNYYETELYIVPNYKKNMAEKKGTSEMISVREYNNNSFVRKIGDFNQDFKHHSIKSFTLNGIHWKGQSGINGDPHTHLVGSKGHYVYEVVGQNLSLAELKKYLNSFKKD